MSQAQKIAEIEAEIARTQRNKATEGHLGLLKAKLAKLKREILEQAKSGGKGGGEGFDVSKTGDARVGMIGFPSVGKSTLLNNLTNTFSEVAAYEFTTLTCIPGVVRHKGAKIQLLDLPGIIEGAKDGKGRGKQVIAVGKTCNLILIVLDATRPMTDKIIIERELEGFGIRLNKKPPEITVKKKEKGGIYVTRANPTPKLSDETIATICKEYKMPNADVTLKSNATADDLIDVLEGNRAYIPAIYILNKVDEITMPELEVLSKLPNSIFVSGHNRWNLEGLVEYIWEKLDLFRIYTKPKGLAPDYEEPVVLPRAKCSIESFCNRLHKQIMKEFKYALVWGSSVKHYPQKVGKDHVLHDEDIVQIVKKV
mmetsp:Transcript_15876/g.23005  ORF Transcript_15876/g.23005 Transcript_15876/m.23005 type:complete len:368 (+) Transcript_15876:42-1145(+)